jgi:hypothetical protein
VPPPPNWRREEIVEMEEEETSPPDEFGPGVGLDSSAPTRVKAQSPQKTSPIREGVSPF